MFSEITDRFRQPLNALYAERDRRLAKGRKVVDLVSGNVTEYGLGFPPELLKSILADAPTQAQVYRPDPLGQRVAREAISHCYHEQGLEIAPAHIVLTPGTSVSYWYAFKLLANPGDEILSPTPSYPLFDSIAVLAGVRMVSYRLRRATRWEIDLDSLANAITPKTRAIVLISPHHPTGAVAQEDEVTAVAELAARHNLAIISDEVFSAFLFAHDRLPRPAATSAPLVLTLNGFSKMFALPSLKIGWMAVSGDPVRVRVALASLEMILDTFLSVNEIAQFAVPAIFERGRDFLAHYQKEIRARAELACRLLSQSPHLSVLAPEGGFHLAVRLRGSYTDEEKAAVHLLRKEGILLHPGYFYDLEPVHWVLSTVADPPTLRAALQAIIHFLAD
jgi:aspartate/methionine/tyrosine aminotransferase